MNHDISGYLCPAGTTCGWGVSQSAVGARCIRQATHFGGHCKPPQPARGNSELNVIWLVDTSSLLMANSVIVGCQRACFGTSPTSVGGTVEMALNGALNAPFGGRVLYDAISGGQKQPEQ